MAENLTSSDVEIVYGDDFVTIKINKKHENLINRCFCPIYETIQDYEGSRDNPLYQGIRDFSGET